VIFEQLGALIFPRQRRPGAVNRKPGRAPKVAAETTSPVSETPPSSTPDALPTPPASVLYDPQFPQTQGLLQFVGSHPAQLLTHATVILYRTMILRLHIDQEYLESAPGWD